MIVTLLGKKSIRSVTLPEKKRGRFYLESDEDDNSFSIEATDERWLLKSNKDKMLYDINGNIQREIELLPMQVYPILDDDAVLYVEPDTWNRKSYQKIRLLQEQEITIGRSGENTIVYKNPFISKIHTVITPEEDKWIVSDYNSKNGTFVNGKAIEEQELSFGDIVYLMGLKIIFGKGFLAFNNPDGKVSVRDMERREISVTGSPEDLECLFQLPEAEKRIKSEQLFHRFPRKKKKFEAVPITVEAPPFALDSSQAPIVLRMGSSMVMGGSALMRGNYTSVLSMLLFPLLNHLYTDKDKKEYEKLRCEKYSEYLENKKEEIRNEKSAEEEILNDNYPSLSTVLTYPIEKKKLWERGNREEDFLHLRIGYGNLPLLASVNYPEKKFDLLEDPLEKEMYLLAKDKVILEQVPIMLPLVGNFICGVLGEEKEKLEFLIRVIIQIVFLHSYDEVKIVLLLDNEIKKEIPAVRFLPHIWNDERDFRFLATDLSSAHQVGEYLNKQLESELEKPRELKKILKERPYYVVLAWNKQIFDSIEILKSVTKEEKNLGVSVITFFEQVLQNSHEMIHLHSEGANKITYLREADSFGDEFFFDEVDEKLAVQMMQVIANTKLKLLQEAYALPKMITFLELFGVGKVEHLNPLKRWKENNPVKSLAVRIGVSADGTPFLMDLHEKYQGPHGLVAGMTGSGKSEFIITFILSLAINFHPDEVAFVLIDYKGGGLAGAFEDEERGIHLPHLVGTITNLDGSAIQRSLMSIESELKRRQRIFNEAKSAVNEGTMDIYTYQKLYRSGKVKTPLPHLFIISDEFAELKSQEPEFMDQLISAARIGRSLGVHLILATQKPSGVVNDQINSNAKFRVCLKVQTRADSNEMLQRPEAAELKETGRFYLQVGYNEYFALGQSAWCGAPYEPQEEAVVHRDDYVQFLDDAGQNIVQVRPAAEKKSSGVSQLVAIVQYLSDLAKKEQIALRKLWLEPLPSDISIQSLQEKYPLQRGDSIETVIGMIDDPENQRQYPLKFDFLKCKNFMVIGGNQAGKTTVLQTMLYTLICNYSPEDVNYYILDYSSMLLNVFDHTRYCGGVWGEGEEPEVEKFFKLLNEIIAERKAEFLAAEVNSFEAYREIRKIPLILVVIDNITGLSSWKGGQTIYYDLNILIREANSVGIKFLISAGSLDDILYKIKKELGTRLVLEAKNRFEYSDILGVQCRFEPKKVPGRGLWREEERPLECHIARYGFDGTEQRRTQKLKETIKHLAQRHCGAKQAKQILRISDTESYAEFCEDILPNRIPLGYSVSDIKKISMPLKQLYCMSLYFGNTNGIRIILQNYLYAALRNGMHLFIMKRCENSIFDTKVFQEMLLYQPGVTLFHSTEEDATRLWKDMYELICQRKKVRNEYCDAHGLSRTSSDSMRLCFSYMQSRTYPVWVIFERFLDFCQNVNKEAQSVMEKIFRDGKGYNYYFAGCYYPDDASALSVNPLHSAFNSEGFALLYGGQFHRQGLVSLPMEYRNLTKPLKTNNSCVMRYHEELYPLWMPCSGEEAPDLEPDDMDIIS